LSFWAAAVGTGPNGASPRVHARLHRMQRLTSAPVKQCGSSKDSEKVNAWHGATGPLQYCLYFLNFFYKRLRVVRLD